MNFAARRLFRVLFISLSLVGPALQTGFAQAKEVAEVTITPSSSEKIVPPYREFTTFNVELKSTQPILTSLRLTFDEQVPDKLLIFSHHTKWILQEDGYYLAGLSGGPQKLTLGDEPQKIEITINADITRKITAHLELLYGKEVVAASKLEMTPLEDARGVVELGKKYPFFAGAALTSLAVLLGGLAMYHWTRRRKMLQKLKSARGRFAARIPEDGQIFISEKENPFHCRLWGLNKKVRIHYSRSQIIIQYTFRNRRHTDVHPIEVKLNRFWTLKLKTERFEENGKVKSSISVLLLPND